MGSSAVTHELDRVPAIFGCMMMAAFFCFFSHKGGFWRQAWVCLEHGWDRAAWLDVMAG